MNIRLKFGVYSQMYINHVKAADIFSSHLALTKHCNTECLYRNNFIIPISPSITLIFFFPAVLYGVEYSSFTLGSAPACKSNFIALKKNTNI